ncbi:MAG: aldo/keto reductase [Armatimonadota bacterium]|nr:MAG: aldo/keto reductase [Armatimonadota bacterium]
MQYRVLGRTGLRVSALGFGTMRFKMADRHVDQELAVSALHRAMDLGVNYFDSAVGYCNSESEIVLGKALKRRRDGIVVSTKYPPWDRSLTADDCRQVIEQSLSRLDTDFIDVYHMHSLDWETAQKVLAEGGAVDGARKAKEEGLVKHLGFSFHDDPERMIDIIEAAPDFDVVTCQYNLLDRANEKSIAAAHERGLGVVIMGPVGGGRLGFPSEKVQGLLSGGTKTTPEIALRFVLSNPNVSVALSGMNTIEMVEQNAATASRESVLTEEERRTIVQALEENRRLADLYCTGCGYCMPCPNGVNIPENFRLMNLHRVWGLTGSARERYTWFGPKRPNNLDAGACVECGECEPKCPQKIAIIEQLKETHRALATQDKDSKS